MQPVRAGGDEEHEDGGEADDHVAEPSCHLLTLSLLGGFHHDDEWVPHMVHIWSIISPKQMILWTPEISTEGLQGLSSDDINQRLTYGPRRDCSLEILLASNGQSIQE